MPINLLDELREALQIDGSALDAELLRMPDLYYRAAEASALAMSRADEAKQKRDEAEAEAQHAVRRQYEGERVTVAEAAAAVALTPSVRAAEQAHNAAKHQHALCKAMADAMQERSYALGRLVTLHSAGYFGEAVPARARADLTAQRVENIREKRANTLPSDRQRR